MKKQYLTRYLFGKMPEAKGLKILNFKHLAHGASRESYTFDLEWEEDGGRQIRGCILRRDPVASVLESERETEFNILKALEVSGIPVPKVYWVEKDPEVLERPFMIMERLTGKVTPSFELVGGEDISFRNEIANQAVALLGKLHSLDWKEHGLDFLGAPKSPTEYAVSQLDHWESVINRFKLEPQPILTEALLWLRAHVPEAMYTTLVHGDFKTDNIICEGRKIKALLDWEMTGIGDPIADLGWMNLAYYTVKGLLCGLISKEELISKWEHLTGYKVDEGALFFWTVFANVKMAAISLTGGQSFVTGATNSLFMPSVAYLTPKLLWDITELLGF